MGRGLQARPLQRCGLDSLGSTSAPVCGLRVLASFALVIALSLFLAGVVSVWLIRDQQAETAEKGIGRLVDPLSTEHGARCSSAAIPDERIASELAAYARYFDVRILLLDSSQHVILDTDLRDPAVGEQIVEAERSHRRSARARRTSPRGSSCRAATCSCSPPPREATCPRNWNGRSRVSASW